MMRLMDFPRPQGDTGLGVHASPNLSFPLGEESGAWWWWVDELKAMGIKWVKLVSGGTSALEVSKFLLANGIMPVVRLYRHQPNPGSMMADDSAGRDSVPHFLEAGVRYFEVNNEPNLTDEWKDGEWAKGNLVARCARSWLDDARYVLDCGGLPAIPAMAPGGNYDDMEFLRGFFSWLRDYGHTDMLYNGVWLAVHPAALNHPINYPYDSVNQGGVPVTPDEYAKGQWAGDRDFVNAQRALGVNTGQQIMDAGASNCWRKWEAVGELFYQYFGFYVPVIATEGGFWPGRIDDPRYHKTTVWDVSYNTRLVSEAMMRGDYPDWFFTTGHWLLASKGMGGDMVWEADAWYSHTQENGQQPVVANLKSMVIVPKPPIHDEEPEPPEPWENERLSDQELAAICRKAKFSGTGLTIAVAVALAESNGWTQALNVNTDGSRDRGIFQINDKWHPEVSDACAFTQLCAAEAAYRISEGGTNWSQWATYTAGVYISYIMRAEAVTTMTEEELRNAAWNAMGIAYNPEASLVQHAIALGLGIPMSDEFDWTGNDGVRYRGQVFHKFDTTLVYCPVGDWLNIMEKVVA